jgi:ketosteroid isomerase-like protein
MRRHIIRLLLLISLFSSANGAGGDDRALAAQALTDYFVAFTSLDNQRVALLCHEPFMLVSSARTSSFGTRADIESWLKPLFAGLKERGYARSEWTPLQVKVLTNGVAIASALIVRYKTDGQEMERFGATYFLRRTNDGWKVAVFTRHDASSVLKLE